MRRYRGFGFDYFALVVSVGLLGVWLIDKCWDWGLFHEPETDPATLDSTELDLDYAEIFCQEG